MESDAHFKLGTLCRDVMFHRKWMFTFAPKISTPRHYKIIYIPSKLVVPVCSLGQLNASERDLADIRETGGTMGNV